jgi:secreted trypsin-like serine protease
MFQAKLLLLLAVVATTIATAEYKIESRIVQGNDAARGQFPFYVFLQVMMPQGVGSCGGSLISDQWIITAGHCVKGQIMDAAAVLGSLRTVQDPTEPGQKVYGIRPEDIHVYPKFSLEHFANDIALIKLPEPVEFSDVIKPISYACSSTKGMPVVAIGNGLTKDSDEALPPILQYTELKTVSLLRCLKSFPFLIFRRSVICVKGEEQRSVCYGDRGGPLITPENSLVGLSSFGSPKGCQVGAPQVFTRISAYTKWVKEVTGIDCKN